MEDQFYYRDRGQVKGPFTAKKLRNLARRGKFARHHDVSEDGDHWIPAEGHPKLFPTASPPPRVPVAKTPDLVPVDSEPTPAHSDQPEVDSVVNEEFVESEGVDDEPTPQPADTPETPSSPTWYYTFDGQELGPVRIDDLRRWAQTGSLATTDFVIEDGMADWVEAGRIEEIFPPTLDPLLTTTTPTAQTSTSAIASFVLGLLGATALPFLAIIVAVVTGYMALNQLGLLGATALQLLASIAAVVTGHLALSQIRRDEGATGGRSFALAGLTLGYIVLFAGAITGTALLMVVAMKS